MRRRERGVEPTDATRRVADVAFDDGPRRHSGEAHHAPTVGTVDRPGPRPGFGREVGAPARVGTHDDRTAAYHRSPPRPSRCPGAGAT